MEEDRRKKGGKVHNQLDYRKGGEKGERREEEQHEESSNAGRKQVHNMTRKYEQCEIRHLRGLVIVGNDPTLSPYNFRRLFYTVETSHSSKSYATQNPQSHHKARLLSSWV